MTTPEYRFKSKALIKLTLILSVMGLLTFGSRDLGYLYFLSVGFAYSSILYYSLEVKPSRLSLIAAVLILGISNYLMHLVALAGGGLVPASVHPYTFYLFPSIVGAFLTLHFISFLYNLKFNLKESIYIIGLTGIVSLITVPVIDFLEIFFSVPGYDYSLNSSLWCIAFSFGLLKLNVH